MTYISISWLLVIIVCSLAWTLYDTLFFRSIVFPPKDYPRGSAPMRGSPDLELLGLNQGQELLPESAAQKQSEA